MKTRLQDYGIYAPPGDSGELSDKGITGTFLYDGESPFLLSKLQKSLLLSAVGPQTTN
jgi:hypothetical protein